MSTCHVIWKHLFCELKFTDLNLLLYFFKRKVTDWMERQQCGQNAIQCSILEINTFCQNHLGDLNEVMKEESLKAILFEKKDCLL